MKYYTLNFITILFLTASCDKEMNKNNDTASSVSEIKSASLLDTITNCKWVFLTETKHSKWTITGKCF